MSADAARDREEIARLLWRYARAIDTRQLDDLRAVFTPDAQIHYALERGTELAFPQMLEWLGRALVIFCRTQHVVSNPLVDVEGDRASGTSYLVASHVQVRKDGREHLVAEGGVYSDRFARTREGWRICARRLDRIWVNGEYLGPDDVRLFDRPGGS